MRRWSGAGALLLAAPLLAWAGYPDAIPSELEVQRAMIEAPGIQAAREELDRSQAQRRVLRAGPYEWMLGATEQRRTDPSGIPYSEQAYEISRTIRWFGKASIDRQLGDQATTAGELSFADNWHEAGRALLAHWFNWLRAVTAQDRLRVQADNARAQMGRVEARVRSGDARAIDLELAQTELDKSLAAVAGAGQVVKDSALQLSSRYPALPLHAPESVANPSMPPGSDADWVRQILADNHEIALAEAVFEAAQLQAERASRDRIPDPTIGVRYSDNFDGNRQVLGLNLSIPIGGAGRRAAADSLHAAARVQGQRARETRARVEAEAQRVVSAARSGIQQWERLHAIAERSAQNAERVRRGYELGEFTINDVLLAHRQAIEADAEATFVRLGALEAVARLELDAHHIWLPPGESVPAP